MVRTRGSSSGEGAGNRDDDGRPDVWEAQMEQTDVSAQEAAEAAHALAENVAEGDGQKAEPTQALSILQLQQMVQDLQNALSLHMDMSKSRRSNADAAVADGKNARNFGQDEYDLYPSHVAFKVYQKGLYDVRCKRVGDASFFAAKRAWDRIVKDFPITEMTKKRLLIHAFDGDARMVYEEVADTNIGATVEDLWKILESRLCNKVHQAALQDRFFSMWWSEKRESFAAFAQRLRSASLALPGGVAEDVLLNRLKAGIPLRMKDQAHLISGNFDEEVSKLSCLSTAIPNREHVRAVGENADDGHEPKKTYTYSGQYDHITCHYCEEKGHISRFCPKKKADRNDRNSPSTGNGSGKDQGSRQDVKVATPETTEVGKPVDEQVVRKEFPLDDGKERVCSCTEPIMSQGCADMDISVHINAFGQDFWVPIDTAARSVWVDMRWFEENGGIILPDDGTASAADGSELSVAGQGTICFVLWGAGFTEKVRVMSALPDKILIGRNFWRKRGLAMSLETNIGSIVHKGKRISGPITQVEVADIDEMVCEVIEDDEVDQILQNETDYGQFSERPEMRGKLRNLLWEKRKIFKGMGCITGLKHRIQLKDGATPVCCPVRRRAPKEEDVERKAMQKLLSMGTLEPAVSPWAANNVFVPKKDGSIRVTSDFRSLNNATVTDSYPNLPTWMGRKL